MISQNNVGQLMGNSINFSINRTDDIRMRFRTVSWSYSQSVDVGLFYLYVIYVLVHFIHTKHKLFII